MAGERKRSERRKSCRRIMGVWKSIKTLFRTSGQDLLAEAINEGAFIVDVRTPAEYAGGSVKGAANIPLDRISSDLSKFKNKKNIVLFCRTGSRSRIAKSILKQKGFENVVNGRTRAKVNHALNHNRSRS